MACKVEMKRIAFIVNVDWFFLSHRLPIALAAQNDGYQVTVITRDTGKKNEIEFYGFSFISLPIGRGKDSLLKELSIILKLRKIYIGDNFDVIYQVGLKIILFGTISLIGIRNRIRVINALSGAGTLFTNKNGISFSLKILLFVFKYALSKKAYFIFQNKDDLELFKKFTPKISIYNSKLIKGSGVDTRVFEFFPLPRTQPKVFLFTGRLLREKGIYEIVESAKQLHKKYFGKIKFVIAGKVDLDNPTSVDDDFIRLNHTPDYLEFVGFKTDINELLKDSYCFIFPSYREGIPKSVIEASSIGRPTIAFDTIGCRDVVINGYNGILVPFLQQEKLTEAIVFLIQNEDFASKYGINARKLALKRFSIEKILEQNLSVINEPFNKK